MPVRMIVIVVFSLICLSFFFHLIGTLRFLVEHFFINENLSDSIAVDIARWKHEKCLTSLEQRSIPRSIHQIWISSKEKLEMFQSFRLASNSCRHQHPTYKYTLWNEEMILDFLKREYHWFVPIYENYPYDMQRIDAMKYFLLFHYGGIYIDLDIKCRVPDLITAMIPIDQQKNEPNLIFHIGTEGISPNTDLMAAKAHHPFFKVAINRLKSANRWFYFYHFTIVLSAGPTYLYGIYRQYPWNENIYYVSNELLWSHLVEGVGGATWYGKDTLLFLYLMKNPFTLAFIVVFTFVFLVSVRKFSMNSRQFLSVIRR